jgi:hypothetical protein
MQSHEWDFGWNWTWTAIGLLLTLVLPLIVGGRFRLPYLALGCLAAIALIACAWVRNRNSQERVAWTVRDDSPPAPLISRGVSVESGAGGLGFKYVQQRLNSPDRPRTSTPVPTILWNLDTLPAGAKYPGATIVERPNRPILLRRWGFTLVWGAEPDKPARGTTWTHFKYVAFPNWFAITVLSLPVLYWLYQRKWGLRRYRRKHNLCQKCGYNLTGTPAAPDGSRCCSECGTVNPAPAASSVKHDPPTVTGAPS